MKWFNEFHQEIGFPIENWQARSYPKKVTIKGDLCWIVPLDADKHASDLFEAHKKAQDDKIWTYIPVGPFASFENFRNLISKLSISTQEVHFAILNAETGRAIGTFALIRIDPNNGVVEIGVIYTPDLQRTKMATEAHYLLMKYVFESLKYRRLEWKCDSLNEGSKKAALRLGYKFEGTFRQMSVYKGRNRNTHWFSIIDKEWDTCRETFRLWLSPENFENGRQKKGLADIRAALI